MVATNLHVADALKAPTATIADQGTKEGQNDAIFAILGVGLLNTRGGLRSRWQLQFGDCGVDKDVVHPVVLHYARSYSDADLACAGAYLPVGLTLTFM